MTSCSPRLRTACVSGLHQATHCAFPSFLCLTVTTWCGPPPWINVLVFSWLIPISATSIFDSILPIHIKSMVSTRSSTRIKQSASPERPFSQASPEPHTGKKDELPPPRPTEERGRSRVQKPLKQARLTAFVHVLICVLLVCIAWYTYRRTIVAFDAFIPTSKFSSPISSTATSISLYTNSLRQFISRQLRWGVQGHGRHSAGTHLNVERRIEELADALGVDPVDFARAIADAVGQLVPRASLSLVASEAKGTGGGRIMEVILDKYAHGVHIADG